MTKQTDRETVTLLILAERSESSEARLRANQVASLFRPSISVAQAEISLKYLEKLGLVDGNFDNPKSAGFRITRKGLHLVDENFERAETKANTNWTHKSDAPTDFASMLFPRKTTATELASEATDHGSPVINLHNNIVQNNAPAGIPSAEKGMKVAAWLAVFLTAVGVLVALWVAGKI